MSNIVDPLVERIGARIRAERDRRRWTLVELAQESGVSRAMINRIERGESNPTAVVLGKLSAAFQLSVATLLDPEAGSGRVRRADEAPQWLDPGTGYARRQISGPGFPAEMAEILLPAGAEVPYPGAAFAFHRQLIWVLDGHLTFREGESVHELDAGDTVELGPPAPCVFINSTSDNCRYAVVLVRGDAP
ncbi:XRE family transcriptional regulator [Streptomyces sp. NBC_00056]|uniref:helix-turn-helix domain-containing protein n=1 Tax=unclassified Streptomyces TaxID=2593676 RepID=UPI00225363AA|nr:MULTISPECIES: XRE family transcriptional regulator [unclassified Streptomyces]MCX5442618.1 XRE family transcriptional regulator [Streptomyces sp. NBC_00063]WUB91189.1 XRE family transcriptional regulator [Streptomyces sp. NBC_00569]